jgi:periplasmic divalent cation tolerance protein
MKAPYCVVLVTTPSLPAARRLARAALEARLVACANVISPIESHYWWRGRIESSREALLLFKTARSRLPRLEQLVREQHPYDTPEFLALPIQRGARRYLAWLAASVEPRN